MVLPQLVAGEHLVWDIASLKEFRKKVMGKKTIEHYKKKKGYNPWLLSSNLLIMYF